MIIMEPCLCRLYEIDGRMLRFVSIILISLKYRGTCHSLLLLKIIRNPLRYHIYEGNESGIFDKFLEIIRTETSKLHYFQDKIGG